VNVTGLEIHLLDVSPSFRSRRFESPVYSELHVMQIMVAPVEINQLLIDPATTNWAGIP
jgi:hypothetical protein